MFAGPCSFGPEGTALFWRAGTLQSVTVATSRPFRCGLSCESRLVAIIRPVAVNKKLGDADWVRLVLMASNVTQFRVETLAPWSNRPHSLEASLLWNRQDSIPGQASRLVETPETV